MDLVIQRLIVLLACLALPAFGQADRNAEAQIKAAFLYKFGGFVEWPARAFERADSAFTIGVLGADAVAAELEQVVTNRTVQGRPIAVRRLKRGQSLAGLHMLFVGSPESARIADLLGAAKGQPLLVVSESEDALSHGSMINFVAVEDKVRFDVALPSAERGQLKISARLLAVARKVISS
jgi:hypothetical protein